MREYSGIEIDQGVFQHPESVTSGDAISIGSPSYGWLRLTKAVERGVIDHELIKAPSCAQANGPTAACIATGVSGTKQEGPGYFALDFWADSQPALLIWATCGCARGLIGAWGYQPARLRDVAMKELRPRYQLRERLALPREHPIRLLLVSGGTRWTDRFERYIDGLDPEGTAFDLVRVADSDAAMGLVSWADVAIVADAVADRPHGEPSEQTSLVLIELLKTSGVPTLGWCPGPDRNETGEDQAPAEVSHLFRLIKEAVDVARVSTTISRE